MATTASFKQQCPSCEAMVPIRDANLIGRKIDCPKCKYRFVVEDPGIAEDEEEASKPSRSRGEEKGANGVKGKPGARRRDEDDDDDDDKAPAKSGGNNKLILGVGLSVVAVGLLVVVGYFLMAGGNSSSDSKSSGTPSQAASNTQKTEPANEDKPAEAAPAASSVSVELLTNLMPPDTEGVCLVHMQE